MTRTTGAIAVGASLELRGLSIRDVNLAMRMQQAGGPWTVARIRYEPVASPLRLQIQALEPVDLERARAQKTADDLEEALKAAKGTLVAHD